MGLFDSAGIMALESGAGRARQGGQNLDRLGYMLRDQMQGGGNSLAREQMQQGLGQALASQQAMIASARPGQAGMATRLGMQNAGNMQMNFNQQIAQQRAREQMMNQEQYLQLLLQGRGQDLNAAAATAGMPTQGEKLLGMGVGLGSAALLASDRRLKKNVKDGGKDADTLLAALKAHSYDYKDEKHGKGNQLGVMAQALEKVPGGKQAVINTPGGKMVDTAKLTGALAAAMGRMNERLSKVEGKKVA